MVAGVALDQTIHSHQHPCPAGSIPEAIHPHPVGLRLDDPHAPTVAPGLQVSNTAPEPGPPTPVRFLPTLLCRAMRITSKGQVTIPQQIREQCGLLPHTEVSFVVENGRVLIEKQTPECSRASDGLQRLKRARLRTRLSTDELLALTRGGEQP